ncbi:WSC-domain-containing protein [Massarina eburnea CBS 473.64]|uniref:WSC-domain-containing protein n=1 Tax=Massarina eburnea CBS 473.64 TaxID=1395130 RepID=A0A6A6RY44_9PLEO|nr:WSC-domain-containing protein [Massarina eburnea CBS 473.64]
MKSVILGLAALAVPATSTFVVQCTSRLFDQRADPVIDPGVASSHVHTISGGSGFNFNMSFEDARASKCTTCNIKQDLSNYWSPKLYYKAQDGSFQDVPIIGDNQGGNLGGMAIYYLTRGGPDNDKLRAFPPGFRMVAGDSSKRSETDDFAGRAVTHKCVGGSNGPDPKHLPDETCDQIRVQVTFPSCWNGRDLDSFDHKTHVSYPKDGNYDGGRCPSTHPVHLVTLFYEVYYDTKGFKDKWYGDKQPFVFANGDGTGYGYHGDFVNGWNEQALQEGLDKCVDGVANCAEQVFGTFNTQGETQACKLSPMIDEPVTGTLKALPGCNTVSYGPDAVTPQKDCASPKLLTTATPEMSGYVDVTSKGYAFIGCGKDNALSRTLGEELLTGDDMTVEKCIDFCKGKKKSFAGIEFGSQCYCGSSLASERKPSQGLNCLMKCGGNKDQTCGGADAISLYQACEGGACTSKVKRESRRLAGVVRAMAKAAL